MNASAEIVRTFGGRARTRVVGLLVQEGKLLLLKHQGLGQGFLWAPPGGGVEFGSAMGPNLVREFAEETGLEVAIKRYLFAYEYIGGQLHAIEHFFEVQRLGGTLKTGTDPEMRAGQQILTEHAFMDATQIAALAPANKHEMLRYYTDPKQLTVLSGYFYFGKNATI